MLRVPTVICTFGVSIALAASAAAQSRPLAAAAGTPMVERTTPMALQSAAPTVQSGAAPARPMDRSQLRHQIYVMEGALARAVEYGAQQLNREMRSVVPDVFMLAGEAQARGVYLDGYGIFFDVQVPIMRQSMMWSLRMMLEKDEAGVRTALDQLRQLLQSPGLDARSRAAAEGAIKRLELQFNPMTLGNLGPALPGPGQTVASGAPTTPSVPPSAAIPPMTVNEPPSNDRPATISMEKLWIKDPNKAYTQAVQSAIIDAMIDWSAPMVIGPDEFLTVAARDNEPRDMLAPQNPMEETVTLLYQIKGSDLAAYRSGSIDREQARGRVVVREF
jgi:hypothetical protein